mmetsp:Transcript_1360/g.3969  ORF Transcript_1360/g.3969 Transcript_1360/m.3969 type:complete len:222 (-) Transcript_1360:1184-1849(-)
MRTPTKGTRREEKANTDEAEEEGSELDFLGPGGTLAVFSEGLAGDVAEGGGVVGVELADGREHESEEGRARFLRPRRELGVELRAHVEGVDASGQFDDLHARPGLVLADEAEALGLECRNQRRVDFVAVPVALPHDGGPVHQGRDRLFRRREQRVARSEAHRAAHRGLVDLGHEDDGVVVGRRRGCVGGVEVGVELGGGEGFLECGARELDDLELHAEADA